MKNVAISDIHEMLPKLPARRVREIRDYISFLVEKEKKHKAFAKRVLEAEKEPTTVFETIDEAMQAILNAPED
jgi:rubrerythrin